MKLICVMPTAADIFEDPPFTLEDVREMQGNPAYVAVAARLRGILYDAAISGEASPDFIAGLRRAVEIVGYVEYEPQREPIEPEDTSGDAILGFEKKDE